MKVHVLPLQCMCRIDCRKCSPTHARTHARTNTQTHVLMSSFNVLLQKTLAMQVSPGGAIRNRGECNRLLLCASPLTTAGYTFIWSAINHTQKGRGGGLQHQCHCLQSASPCAITSSPLHRDYVFNLQLLAAHRGAGRVGFVVVGRKRERLLPPDDDKTNQGEMFFM